jgi:hypothetical protein
MILSTIKYFLSPLLLLLLSTKCDAQEADNYIYKDSTILYSKDKVNDTMEVQAPTEDNISSQENASNNFETAKTDTSLISNQLFITSDNARNLKNEKQLAYAKKLDSLLKDLQQKQTANLTTTTNRFSFLISFFSAPLTKIIFWLLAAFLVVFIIVKLFFAEGFFLRRSATTQIKPLQEEEQHDPVSVDYNRLLKHATRNGDYRLATRYLYLQSLQQLIVAGAIVYSQDKTNYQYLMEINNQPYRQEFSLLTLQYEYAWYGNFLLDEAGFTALQKKFTSFNKQV